jgi:hypothetical protein
MQYKITVISSTPPASTVYTATVLLIINKILIFSLQLIMLIVFLLNNNSQKTQLIMACVGPVYIHNVGLHVSAHIQAIFRSSLHTLDGTMY